MANRRKRKRREEELEEREGRDPSEEAVQEKEEREKELTPADRVLALQKAAGNRAVGAAIARWGVGTLPLAAFPHWPKEPEMIVDGTTIPIASISWDEQAPGRAGTGVGKPQPGGDVRIATTPGLLSADLWRRTREGTHLDTVVIVMPSNHGTGITITLTDVVFSGYESSTDKLESWTLNFKKRELSESPPQVQPRP
jgi:type VI secretion system (T6SS) effector Hcp